MIPTLRPGEFLGAMTRVRNPDGSPIDVTDLRQATWGELEGDASQQKPRRSCAHMPGFADASSATPRPRSACGSRRIAVRTCSPVRTCSAARSSPMRSRPGRGRRSITSGADGVRFLPPGRRYQIPFGSLRSREIENLLVAGRCISADHDALASTRVMAPSLALGQAAGTAALAVRAGGPVGELDIDELQGLVRQVRLVA